MYAACTPMLSWVHLARAAGVRRRRTGSFVQQRFAAAGRHLLSLLTLLLLNLPLPLPHQANLSENINKGYMESVKHLRDMLMAYEWDLHGKELAGRK